MADDLHGSDNQKIIFTDLEQEDDIRPTLSRMDYEFQAGFGYNVFRRFGIQLQYQRGLRNILPDEMVNGIRTQSPSGRFNQGFSFRVNYTLTVSKKPEAFTN